MGAMNRRGNKDPAGDTTGVPGPIGGYLFLDPVVLDPAESTTAGADYDPLAPFRSQAAPAQGSVSAATSATDAHVEWVGVPQRYGHFSGRPLDPHEIAEDYRRKTRRRWLRRGTLVAAFVAAVSLFVWNLNNDPWLPLSLAEPGTCFQDSQSSLIVRHDTRYEVRTTIEVVDCGAPHQFETIGTVAMSGFGDTTPMAAAADALCAGVFEDYVGATPGGAGPWQMASFPPYLMFLAGDRAHCLAFQGTYLGATDDPYDPVMVEGTARDAAS